MRSFCKKTPKWSHTPKDTTRSFRGQFTSIDSVALAKLKAMANEVTVPPTGYRSGC
jgi:hypothetical protein